MKIDELIRQIPMFKDEDVVCEPLNGGFSNQTYKLTHAGTPYVLRRFGKQTDFLQLSRASEVEVIRMMNRRAGSPAVLEFDEAENFAVFEFLEGRMVTGDDLSDGRICEHIIKRLKEIHETATNAPVVNRRCSPYHLIESYLKGADQLNVKQPEGLAPLLRKMENIAYERSKDRTYSNRFCHNDYYTFNLLLNPDKGKLHVLDWELSGMGDVFFDLATIPFSNRFSQSQEREWLQLYFGFYDEELYAILQDMKFINMLRECSWGLLHSGLAEETVNHSLEYYKHAENVIDRLQQGLNFL